MICELENYNILLFFYKPMTTLSILIRFSHLEIFIINIFVVVYKQRALRSRSLRDGSLSYKGRFATFVRSCSALRASRKPLKVSYLKSACLITPFGHWNQVNPTIFEICLLYVNNNNKYPIEKFLNAKFGISMLVYFY